MAWEFSLGARWLGWTALYALIYRGSIAVLEFTHQESQSVWRSLVYILIPAVVAFAIGVRFRSRWWVLGPLVAVSLVFAANWGTGDTLPWFVFFFFPIVFYASLFSYAAFVGVQWGEQRYGASIGPRHTVPQKEGASG